MRKRRVGELYCAAAMVLAGSTFVANAAVERYPILGALCLRYAGSAVLMMVVVRPWRREVARPSPRQLTEIALTAALGMVGLNALSVLGLRGGDPASVTVIVGAVPLVLALATPLTARRPPAARPLACAGIVVLGTVIVEGTNHVSLASSLWALGALACYSAFIVTSSGVLAELGPNLMTMYGTMFASVEAGGLGLATEGTRAFPVVDARSGWALVWLSIPVAVVVWYRGLALLGPERTALFSGIVPVAAAFLAPLAGTARLTGSQVIGSLVVGIGISAGVAASRASRSPDIAVVSAQPARPDDGIRIGRSTQEPALIDS